MRQSILYKISRVIINDKEKKDMKFVSKKILTISMVSLSGAILVPYCYMGNLFGKPVAVMAFLTAVSGYLLYIKWLRYLRKKSYC